MHGHPLEQNQFFDTRTCTCTCICFQLLSFWSFIPPVDLVSHKLLQPQGKTSGRFPQTVCFVQTWVGRKTAERISPLRTLMIMPDRISLHQLVRCPPNICLTIDDNLIIAISPALPKLLADLQPTHLKSCRFTSRRGDFLFYHCWISTPLNSTLSAVQCQLIKIRISSRLS